MLIWRLLCWLAKSIATVVTDTPLTSWESDAFYTFSHHHVSTHLLLNVFYLLLLSTDHQRMFTCLQSSARNTVQSSFVWGRQPWHHPRSRVPYTLLTPVLEDRQLPLFQLHNFTEPAASVSTVQQWATEHHCWSSLYSVPGKTVTCISISQTTHFSQFLQQLVLMC